MIYENKVFDAYCRDCEVDKPSEYVQRLDGDFKDYHYIKCKDCNSQRTIRTGRLEELITR